MKIIENIVDIPQHELALTIGNFDGVHVGHQRFLQELKSKADRLGLKLLVITFLPHPKQILSPANHFLITDYISRRDILKNVGVDYLLEIKFTRDFSTLTPNDFLDQYLGKINNLKLISVGHDFAFGANKSGSDDIVERFCDQRKIEFSKQGTFSFNNELVSSSLIRKYLTIGDLEKVKSLLGRNFTLRGVVVKGKGRGRKIGFSTANLSYDSELIVPQAGVYKTNTIYDYKTYPSITNVGHNPTFGFDDKINVETHILDFDQDIYGEKLEVIFLRKIRAEMKFDGPDSLVRQIKSDISSIREKK